MDANKTLFIGQDLHSNNVVVCIVVNELDNQGRMVGKVLKTKKISLASGTESYIKFIAPYLDE